MADEFRRLSPEDQERMDKMLRSYRTLQALESAEKDVASEAASVLGGAARALPESVISGLETMDTQVTNRARAAVNALLQQQNPLAAAIENPPTDPTAIGEDVLKKLERANFPVAKLPANELSKKDVYPAAGALGLGIETLVDPLMHVDKFSKALRLFRK